MQCLWRLAVAAIVSVSLRCARFLEIRGWSRWRRGQKSWLRGTTLGLRSMLRLAPRRRQHSLARSVASSTHFFHIIVLYFESLVLQTSSTSQIAHLAILKTRSIPEGMFDLAKALR